LGKREEGRGKKIDICIGSLFEIFYLFYHDFLVWKIEGRFFSE